MLYIEDMPKPKDINQIASSIVGLTTGKTAREKNSAAVELGRLGGLKGGKARARKLSPDRRKQIARKAARTRWGTK